MTELRLQVMFWKVFFVCFSLLLLSGSVFGLNCYQCNSTLDASCQDQFEHSSDNPQRSLFCKMNNARFCIKATGVWGGIVGTHRFCSSRDMGDQCQYFGYDDHDRMYRACIYTCTSDDCNGSSQLSYNILPLVTGLLFFILKSLC